MNSSTLELLAARYQLGLASGPDLVRAAEAAMHVGLDSDSLLLLALEENPIMSEVGPLFVKALRELSIELPGRDRSYAILLRHHMSRIAGKQVAP